MASISEGSQSSNVTPVAKRRGPSSPVRSDSTSKVQKRRKADEGVGFRSGTSSACWCGNFEWKKQKICPKVVKQKDPFVVENLLDSLDSNKYGSTKKDIEDLIARREKLLAHVHEAKAVVPGKPLNVEKCPIERGSSLDKHGIVTKNTEDHKSASFMTLRKHLKMEEYPNKENLKSNPPAMPYIIDLEDINEPPDRGTNVQSAKAEGRGRTFQPVTAEEIAESVRPIVIIDSEDEDIDNKKNLCPYEVIDLTEPVNFSAKNFEDLDRAEDQRLSGGNYYSHASETKLKKSEGAVCSYQASHMDDQVIDLDSDEDQILSRTILCHADEPEHKADNGGIGCFQALDMHDKVTDLDSTEDQILSRANLCHADESEHKADNGVIGCFQAFDMHDEVTNLGCAENQGLDDGNVCHVGKTELQKDEGGNAHFCHADETVVKKDKGLNMGGESDEKMEEDKEQTKGSSDSLANISEVERTKGVYVGVGDDGNVCHAVKTELQKDKGLSICHAGETVVKNDKGLNMGGESDEKMEEDKEQTKSSSDGLANISEIEKNKGVYVGVEDDGNVCHVGKTELQKDKGRNANFCHAGETVVRKDKGFNMGGDSDENMEEDKEQTKGSSDGLANVSEVERNKGVYVGVEDGAEMEEGGAQFDYGHDGLGNIWNEMAFALECSKDTVIDSLPDEHTNVGAEDCDHSFILKDDIGSVCRVCGLVEKGIETMIEYQFGKSKRSGRTYNYERSHGNVSDRTKIVDNGMKGGEYDCSSSEIAIHPRHQKLMKPHQLEGFNFLLSNLVTDQPGGCIMAHAPGSGKTFMIISFLQSFMAKYPSSRPLIVLPRGILSTWKKEFRRWQVEDMPLYDLYSSKAESRSQQYEVLKKWESERSILFLGYKQFASIVCDIDSSKTTIECQNILLTCPSILILDEGHTPRNQNTDILKSLEKVQTRRKVVLSGTLYQNHVKEVFNVLNLVRPKFLKTDIPRSIKRRILSKVQISSTKSSLKKYSNDDFYDMVERTILDDQKFNRKVNIIQDLREMTSKVLHYYKGDSLDELPGLVDFTVFLELSTTQKREVTELKKCKSRFKISSEGSAIYVHPQLKMLSIYSGGKSKVNVEKLDRIMENLKETGVKAKFYLNLLQLCESTGEKLLVFSQYLVPLKFLERLTVKVKNYTVGKEIFVITGDSDSDIRDSSMEQFNTSSDAKVFFGSIKACGEGISLVGASRIIVLDIHLNPSVTRQAIGRAFRPGQERKVYTYRLVASGSPEEEDHLTCFRKECIAKMWFEWNAYQGQRVFDMETIDVNDCGDPFLEAPRLNADVVSVCKR